jgi:hypothetical protein
MCAKLGDQGYWADMFMRFCIPRHMGRQIKSNFMHAHVHTCIKRICR